MRKYIYGADMGKGFPCYYKDWISLSDQTGSTSVYAFNNIQCAPNKQENIMNKAVTFACTIFSFKHNFSLFLVYAFLSADAFLIKSF